MRPARTARPCSPPATASRCASPTSSAPSTVAFPAVSAGVYGWPMDDAARIAVGTVRDTPTSVREVRFVLFGDEAFDAFRRAHEA